jgi:hypothetical protein
MRAASARSGDRKRSSNQVSVWSDFESAAALRLVAQARALTPSIALAMTIARGPIWCG